jgi:arylsulfatase A-like enzyme
MEGRSLLPVIAGEARDWRSSFLVEYYTDTVFPRVLTMGYSAVRTDRYKYIEYRELTDMNELYDLQSDPYEERNIIRSPGAAPILDGLRKELAGLRGAK